MNREQAPPLEQLYRYQPPGDERRTTPPSTPAPAAQATATYMTAWTIMTCCFLIIMLKTWFVIAECQHLFPVYLKPCFVTLFQHVPELLLVTLNTEAETVSAKLGRLKLLAATPDGVPCMLFAGDANYPAPAVIVGWSGEGMSL